MEVTDVQKCIREVWQEKQCPLFRQRRWSVSFYGTKRPVMCSVCLLIRLHGSGVCALLGLSTEAVVHVMLASLAIKNPVIYRKRCK